MKILFLTPWYPDSQNPNHGIFVRDQAVAIRQKHEVWVVSSKINYSGFGLSTLQRTDSVFEGLPESRLSVKRSLPVFNQLNFFLRTAWESVKIARTFRPDLIHGNIGYPGAFWSWILSRLLKIPFIVTEHTRISNNFRSPIHRYLTLIGFRRASQVVAVSRWHADEIETYIGQKPVVISNVVNFEKYPDVRPKPQGNVFHIGFLGGLNTSVKGLDVLLHAIAKVQGNIKLHIGGDGSLLESYQAMSKKLGVYDKCIFYGRVAHEQVNGFMGRVHLFVSASRSETFGIAMVEALACGVPVLASDSGGPSEFITSMNGLIVPVENVPELANGITQMMKGYQRFDPVTIREQVISKFSADTFLKKIDVVYTEVLSTYQK